MPFSVETMAADGDDEMPTVFEPLASAKGLEGEEDDDLVLPEFATMDADGDGVVTAEEIAKSQGVSLEEAKKIIDRYDEDGDGVLQADEYGKWMEYETESRLEQRKADAALGKKSYAHSPARKAAAGIDVNAFGELPVAEGSRKARLAMDSNDSSLMKSALKSSRPSSLAKAVKVAFAVNHVKKIATKKKHDSDVSALAPTWFRLPNVGTFEKPPEESRNEPNKIFLDLPEDKVFADGSRKEVSASVSMWGVEDTSVSHDAPEYFHVKNVVVVPSKAKDTIWSPFHKAPEINEERDSEVSADAPPWFFVPGVPKNAKSVRRMERTLKQSKVKKPKRWKPKMDPKGVSGDAPSFFHIKGVPVNWTGKLPRLNLDSAKQKPKPRRNSKKNPRRDRFGPKKKKSGHSRLRRAASMDPDAELDRLRRQLDAEKDAIIRRMRSEVARLRLKTREAHQAMTRSRSVDDGLMMGISSSSRGSSRRPTTAVIL